MGEIGIVSLVSNNNLLIIFARLLIAVVFLYFLGKTTFNKDKILTQWKDCHFRIMLGNIMKGTS